MQTFSNGTNIVETIKVLCEKIGLKIEHRDGKPLEEVDPQILESLSSELQKVAVAIETLSSSKKEQLGLEDFEKVICKDFELAALLLEASLSMDLKCSDC